MSTTTTHNNNHHHHHRHDHYDAVALATHHDTDRRVGPGVDQQFVGPTSTLDSTSAVDR